MATARTVLTVITDVFKTEFGNANVSNRFYTVEDLLNKTHNAGNIFPWVVIGIAPHLATLDLSGTLEVEARIPIVAIIYVKTPQEEELQLELADVADRVKTILKAAAGTFTTNCFGIEAIELEPMEDEVRLEYGFLMVSMSVITGN